MAGVSPAAGAMGPAAIIGLGISVLLVRCGLLMPSFIDAQDRPQTRPDDKPSQRGTGASPAQSRKNKHGKKRGDDRTACPAAEPVHRGSSAAWAALLPIRIVLGTFWAVAFGSVLSSRSQITAAAISKEHGVNPRKEILREVLFLCPALGLAAAAYLLVTKVGAVGRAWGMLTDPHAGYPLVTAHVNAFLGAVYGYLIGGLWVWGTRILGTLAFNKEAMGLGDAHLMAAVGAVTGWMVPTLAFFVAPVFGLLWALYLRLTRGQRELPYGPWLAVATLAVMLFYDRFHEVLRIYMDLLTRA
jgi:hypothetical protein